MSNVLHRTTKEYRASVNTPDFPTGTWIINPVMPSEWLATPINKYLIITGDVVTWMDQAARDAVDAAEANDLLAANRAGAIALSDSEQTPEGFQIRELFEVFNKRDNYVVNRVIELQDALDAVKASIGPAENIRAAIPASWLASATRPRADAIADYTADINAGGAD